VARPGSRPHDLRAGGLRKSPLRLACGSRPAWWLAAGGLRRHRERRAVVGPRRPPARAAFPHDHVARPDVDPTARCHQRLGRYAARPPAASRSATTDGGVAPRLRAPDRADGMTGQTYAGASTEACSRCARAIAGRKWAWRGGAGECPGRVRGVALDGDGGRAAGGHRSADGAACPGHRGPRCRRRSGRAGCRTSAGLYVVQGGRVRRWTARPTPRPRLHQRGGDGAQYAGGLDGLTGSRRAPSARSACPTASAPMGHRAAGHEGWPSHRHGRRGRHVLKGGGSRLSGLSASGSRRAVCTPRGRGLIGGIGMAPVRPRVWGAYSQGVPATDVSQSTRRVAPASR
jgi:hypothetical protein